MAKIRSLFEIQGTIAGYTTVNSKAYETHIRAARGSKSKVEVNDTLKAHNALLTSANVPARLVKNAIDEYRSDFPGGQLWQDLVGMFKRQLKEERPLSIGMLKYKHINPNYPLSRLLKRGIPSAISVESGLISVTLRELYPMFQRKTIDGYQTEVIAIFIDFDKQETTSDSSTSKIIPLNYAEILNFELKGGKPGDQYLICLKLIGCSKGIVQIGNSTRGMQVIDTGIMEEDEV